MTTQSPSTLNIEQWWITAFYKFTYLEKLGRNLDQIQKDLESQAEKLGVLGLLILAPEGVNSTCCAPSESQLNEFKQWLCKYLQTSPDEMGFKDSFSQIQPFRRYKVKQRPEIVTISAPDLFPEKSKNHHLTPSEWNEVLKNEKDFVMVDTRNWYETKIGTFKGAVSPDTDQFTEFPEWAEHNVANKDKKMLIFCTGGIRCEKGILELERRGFNNVYQLEGGILNYLKQHPNDQFEGECFVFDQRVAVRQDLSPSERYHLCPHCGQPGETRIECARCDTEMYICETCASQPAIQTACSKHCAHQMELHPGRKGPAQVTDPLTGRMIRQR